MNETPNLDQLADTSLLRISQAAKVLDLSTATVRRLISKGKLSKYKLEAGSTRVNVGDLKQFIASCKQKQ